MKLQEKHDKKIKELATKLEDDGYKVTLNPDSNLLPPQLKGFRPDILAVRQKENLIVEVLSRPELVRTPDIRAVAQAIRQLPNWQFDVAIIAESPTEAPPNLLDEEEMYARLKISDEVANAGDNNAAFLLLWTILEAWLRYELISQSQPTRIESPLRLLKEALSNGLISEDEHKFLRELGNVRNHVAHGEVIKSPHFEKQYKDYRNIIYSVIFDKNKIADTGVRIT